MLLLLAGAEQAEVRLLRNSIFILLVLNKGLEIFVEGLVKEMDEVYLDFHVNCQEKDSSKGEDV